MRPGRLNGNDPGARGDLSERAKGSQQQQYCGEREPTLAQVHALPKPPAEKCAANRIPSVVEKEQSVTWPVPPTISECPARIASPS
jgi:hypothetical protein